MSWTSTEWLEVVDWVKERFPLQEWKTEQAAAYFFDVERFDVADVWAGLHSLYEAGLAFPPNGSQIVAAARKQSQARHRPELKSLPSETVTRDPAIASLEGAVARNRSVWESFCMNRFGEILTAHQVVVRLHTERTDCRSPSCDIHREKVVAR